VIRKGYDLFCDAREEPGALAAHAGICAGDHRPYRDLPRAAISRIDWLCRAARHRLVEKAAGVYKGRPASIDAARVRELKMQGMGPTDIAKTLKAARPFTECWTPRNRTCPAEDPEHEA
jgi:hypothetical protein